MIHAYSNKNQNYNQKLINTVKKYKPGGIIFFQGNPKNQAILTNKIQASSKTPLLISIDAECGLGSRLKNTISFPKQMTLGAIQNDSLIYEMGREIGKHCKRMGIHINFAPVADINNNPHNPVINNRSFGENKLNVSKKAIAYMKGLQAEGIIAVGKHFPGHGDTKSDSHTSLPIINHSKEHLANIELSSFQALINEGIMGIMTAHLSIPSLDSTGRAASMSKKIVTDLLQKKMNFKGLCFTDALNMKGARIGLRPGETDAKALLAGNDILLFTANLEKAVVEIKKLLKSGQITQKEIDAKCKKVLMAKYFCGLKNKQQIKINNLWSDLNTTNSFIIKRKIYSEAITLIKNENNLIPLKRLDTLNIASVAIGSKKITRFQNTLLNYTDIKHYNISSKATKEEFDQLIKKLSPYNLIIISKSKNSNNRRSHYGNTKNSIDFIGTISKQKKVIFNYPGNPYALAAYKSKDIKSILVSYNENLVTDELSAEIIFGGNECKGKLPVSISDTYKSGTGFTTAKTRLGYNLPEDVGADSKILKKEIDSIVNDAIKKKATPGCQVLIAKDGYIIFNKSYGYYTYRKKQKVTDNSIYDIASLTKISATLPALMNLYDNKQISIDEPLRKYLPEVKNTNKENLIIKDILIHQAGLKPFINFFQELIDKERMNGSLYSRRKNSHNSFKLTPYLYIDPNFKYKKGTFSSKKFKNYTIKVTPSLYLSKRYRDTILNIVYKSEIDSTPEYKYSDLGFILLKKSIEHITQKDLERYCCVNFYKKLGAKRTTFKPIKQFNNKSIVPSTYDKIFRKQILRGYVHDPAAALLGGFAGNAGLFSNALGLAKIMSVYLQKGSYGGERYFNASTINKFTSKTNNGDNRRGLGFDKPEMNKEKEGPTCQSASAFSYGHSGFTGTYAWCDPSNNTIYIFLSNRTYPDENNSKLLNLNVRTNIQEVIYKSINSFTKNHK
jgi:beta-glucosidase-like glycosyl hydrolase/CubicO group peptidase (beta-lactamase class C family)